MIVPEEKPMERPSISQQVTWIYTHDLQGTARFYGETLGLEQVLDQGSCRIYKTSATSFLGVCQVRPGRFVEPKLFHFHLPAATQETAPYRIEAGSLGANYPPRALSLSPRHALLDPTGVWHIPKTAAKHNPGIQQYGVGKPITYYHIECPDFYRDNLLAEGAVVESFKNRQGARTVVYEWVSSLNGFRRVPKEDSYAVPTERTTLVVY